MKDKEVLILLFYISLSLGKLFPLVKYASRNGTKFQFESIGDQLCQKVSSQRCCDCDEGCFLKKSCCIDKLWNQTHPLPLDDYVDMFIKKINSYKKTSCESVIPITRGSRYRSYSILMVKSCIKNANKDDIEACLNNTDKSYLKNLPVLGSDNYIYRSGACALCNNVKNFEYLEITLRCSQKFVRPIVRVFVHVNGTTTSTTTTQKPINVDECTFTIDKSSKILSAYAECSYPPKNSCSPTSPYYKRCNSYNGVINNDFNRNIDCYKCENTNFLNKPNLVTFVRTCAPKTSQRKVFTLSQILNFGDTNSKYCDKGFAYDILLQKCIEFSCPRGYIKGESKCIQAIQNKKTTISIKNANYDSCFFNTFNGVYVEAGQQKNNTELEHVLFNLLNSSNNLQGVFNSKKSNIYRISLDNKNDAKTIFLNHKKFLKHVDSMIITSVKHQKITSHYGFDASKDFGEKGMCYENQKLNINKVNFTQSCDIIFSNRTYHFLDYISYISVNQNEIIRNLVSCQNYHLKPNCHPTYNIKNNYELNENKTLKYKSGGKTFKYLPTEYSPERNGYSVCIKGSINKRRQWKTTLTNIEYYISLIGLSINIVCYLLIVGTYTIFSELRNTPTLNTSALCITLLISDITFLIITQKNGDVDSCVYLSVILHWSLLAVQFWIAIIAFDIASRFGKSNLFNKSKKRFYVYCAIVFVSSLSFVFVTILLDQTNTAYIGYGDGGYCWINGTNALIVTYILPIGIIFIFALSSFIFTLYKLTKAERKSQRTLGDGRSSSVSLIKISIKLALILGVTEITGFIQIYKSSLSENELIFNSIFGFIFTILRSFKGLILFGIYLCNKKIVKLYSKTITENLPENFGHISLSNMTASSNVSR